MILQVALILLIWLLLRVNRLVFRKIQEKRTGLQLMLFERLNSRIIVIGGVILAFSIFGGIDSVWKTLLGGTAIISAVLAFAAQDVIKDILAGLMISLYKPFEIGNRIQLEDGTVGIVKEITMRHVVILRMDTIYEVIPNSKLNTMSLTNYSYQSVLRSAKFSFQVAYDADVEQAMDVIRQAVMDSEYSVPCKETDHGTDYALIYFMAYEDSSLRLETTVYFEASTPSEVLISDINCRVNLALKENGIEIPYNYIHVVTAADHKQAGLEQKT